MMNKSEPTVADLRDAVLKRMGPLDGPCYAPGAVALLDAYASKLEDVWRWREGFEARCRAEEAIRAAIDNLPRPTR